MSEPKLASYGCDVVVHIEGGVIHDIEMPRGVRVFVRDYDLEGADASDEDLDRGYIESCWESECAST